MKRVGLRAVYLYDDPDTAGLDVDALAAWLAARLPQAHVAARTDYFTFQLARFAPPERDALTEALAHALERAEIHNLVHPRDRQRLPPVPPRERDLDVVYEATALQRILARLLAPEEAVWPVVHIMFTSQYLGVWRENEAYLSLQVAILGTLNIISTSGLIEALALPRRYHFLRQQFALFGVSEETDDFFAAETLGYGDPRLNDVCQGYILQAVFYRLTGDIGCAEPRCRLHVPQTHREALRIHVLQRPRLCERHAQEFRRLGGEPE